MVSGPMVVSGAHIRLSGIYHGDPCSHMRLVDAPAHLARSLGQLHAVVHAHALYDIRHRLPTNFLPASRRIFTQSVR